MNKRITKNQPDGFKFEAIGAPIPIMAAEWLGDNPYEARIFFHNEKFIEAYGDHRGKLLVDLLNEITVTNNGSVYLAGKLLFEELLQHGFIRSLQGGLANKRVELFAKLQVDTPKCIQSSVFDVTERLLDHTTGLPGRQLFFDRLGMSLYKAMRNDEAISLLYLDLDAFKKANDLYGHQAGDAILIEVANRLRSVVRKHETVARIGGDEFVVLLSNTAAKLAQKFCNEKLIPLLNRRYELNSVDIDFIGVSVGVVSYPEHGAEINELMAMADTAMYKAKKTGKNRAIIY